MSALTLARRGFLALLAAPAIVPAASLMRIVPLRVLTPPEPSLSDVLAAIRRETDPVAHRGMSGYITPEHLNRLIEVMQGLERRTNSELVTAPAGDFTGWDGRAADTFQKLVDAADRLDRRTRG